MPTGNTAAEKKVSKQLINLWTTFAKTGSVYHLEIIESICRKRAELIASVFGRVPSGLPGSPGWSPLDPAAEDLHLLRFDKNGDLSFDTVPQIGLTDFWMSQPLEENIPIPVPEDPTADEAARDEL